jgi:antitoxin component of MazEF toxin-antitoxin module
MKVMLRKIGNSVGVIIPKATLDSWGVGEGDHLELSQRGISPPSLSPTSHDALDEHKRRLALAVAAAFTPREIRAHSLANLHRWKESGVWVSAYDEWKRILEGKDDGALYSAMLGRDERATRLRQSAPYAGLLPREQVRAMNEEATR